MMTSEISTPLEPLRKSVTVKKTPREAFALFTEGVATWWPLRTHSVFEGDAVTCVFESGKGGRIFERNSKGEESLWGTVTTWEPHARVVYMWHPGRGPEDAQEVEVRFSASGSGTRVDLVHTGWEKFGPRAKEMRKEYDGGWDVVLGKHYVGAAS